MSRSLIRLIVALAIAATTAGLGGAATETASATSGTTFSGHATALFVDPPFLAPIELGATEKFAAGSPAFQSEAMFLEVDLNDRGVPVTAEAGHGSTVAQGQQSRSQASLASLNLNVAGTPISATFLSSSARARCAAGLASVSGESEIANLNVGGQPIVVSGAPNQTVPTPVPGLTIIINKQEQGPGTITVTALYVEYAGLMPGPEDDLVVRVAEAHADIRCGNPPGGGCLTRKLTGGGWFAPSMSGDRASFAVAGETGTSWGHLNLVDRRAGVHFQGRPNTLSVVNETNAVIEGTGSGRDGVVRYWIAYLEDIAEPGREADSILLHVFEASVRPADPATAPTVYAGGGKLDGGNIQIHKCK